MSANIGRLFERGTEPAEQLERTFLKHSRRLAVNASKKSPTPFKPTEIRFRSHIKLTATLSGQPIAEAAGTNIYTKTNLAITTVPTRPAFVVTSSARSAKWCSWTKLGTSSTISTLLMSPMKSSMDKGSSYTQKNVSFLHEKTEKSQKSQVDARCVPLFFWY